MRSGLPLAPTEQAVSRRYRGESSGQRTRPGHAGSGRRRRIPGRRRLPGRRVPGGGRVPRRPGLPGLLQRPLPPGGHARRAAAYSSGTRHAAAPGFPASAAPPGATRPECPQPPVGAPRGRSARRRPPPPAPGERSPAPPGRQSSPPEWCGRQHFYPERKAGSPGRPPDSPAWPAPRRVLRPTVRRPGPRWPGTEAAPWPVRPARSRVRAGRRGTRSVLRIRRTTAWSRPGTAWSGPARPGPLRTWSAGPGSLRSGPARPGPLRT
jgi:hypothetical protein